MQWNGNRIIKLLQIKDLMTAGEMYFLSDRELVGLWTDS